MLAPLTALTSSTTYFALTWLNVTMTCAPMFRQHGDPSDAVLVLHCHLQSITDEDYGGSITVWVDVPTATVYDSMFINSRVLSLMSCEKGYGAAMFLDCSDADVQRCCGEGCHAFRMGSFLHMGSKHSEPNWLAADCTIYRCNCSGYLSQGRGGAVSTDSMLIELNSINFTECTGDDSAAIDFVSITESELSPQLDVSFLLISLC
jgi:hypothetical protein